MKKHFIKYVMMLTLLVGLVAQPLSGLAADKEEVYYVALGDSLAAGRTPDGKEGPEYLGYTDYIAEKYNEAGILKTFVRDYAVSGYTTQNVLDDINNNVTKGTNGSIQEVLKEATHVTLDAGANDLLHTLTIDKEKGSITYDQAEVVKAFGQLQVNLGLTIEAVKKLNPEVKVYVMGYYNPLPHIPAEYQGLLNLMLAQLNAAIKGVAEKAGATYVATDKTIAANVDAYLPNPMDIHLSTDGYKVLADQFWAVMKPEVKEQEKPEPQKPTKPVITVPKPVVYWEGAVLKKGQIGKVEVIKPINLWKRVGNKLQYVRVLKPGESYRIYSFSSDFGGQFGVGGGYYITRMETHVKYKTPSKAKLKLVNE